MAQNGPQQLAGVSEGQILAGKYRVERVLGVGGMGAVVAAHHLQLDTKVAIKFMLPGMLAHPETVARFAREAKAAVKIQSEHVARVFDVGTLDNGAPYMVMEYLEGEDLSSWLERRGPLPIEQAVDFVLQACVAVAEAHALGIVHRDLKPANLFCLRRNDGQHLIKVLDFGISKMASVSSSDASMTHTATVMGSPLYMSPEQLKSAKDVDTQTDIWALGVILYELLAGAVPFAGESVMEVAMRIATEAPAPIRAFRPEIPSGLQLALLRCLERDCGRRYRTVAELAGDIAVFGSRRAGESTERIAAILGGVGRQREDAAPSAPRRRVAREQVATATALGRTTAGRASGQGSRVAWVITAIAGIGLVGAAILVVARGVGPAKPDAARAAIALPAASASPVANDFPGVTKGTGNAGAGAPVLAPSAETPAATDHAITAPPVDSERDPSPRKPPRAVTRSAAGRGALSAPGTTSVATAPTLPAAAASSTSAFPVDPLFDLKPK